MSTFLQLVADLHREVRAAGVAPTSVVNQRGEAARLVSWVQKADRLVQQQWENWKFMRASVSTTLTANVLTLPAPPALKMWDYDTMFIKEDGTTEKMLLDVVEYEDVKSETLDTSFGMPSRVIVMPDNSLQFEQGPDGPHLFTSDYYRKPVLLAANGDISPVPEEFHDAILGRAMIFYALHEGAPEIENQGTTLYTDTMSKLEASQLPNKKNSRFRTGGHFVVVPQ